LSDKRRREIYDQVGEEGLKGGASAGQSGGGGGGMGGGGMGGGGGSPQYSYTFSGDPRATFSQFFGTSDPFASFFNMGDGGGDDMGSGGTFINIGGMPMPGMGMGGGMPGQPGMGGRRPQSFNINGPGPGAKKSDFGGAQRQQQDPAIEHDLYVSLEDINKGCVKKMKISRNVIGSDGNLYKEDKVLSIAVKAGWKAGTKITFAREGDQATGKIPADIIFVIRDKPHPVFKRESSDLKYTAKISLRDALCGTTIEVPNLTGTKSTLNLTERVIKPNTIERIQGKGLPYPKEPSRRGDLLVQFDIQFPDKLTKSQRDIIFDIFPK
jgi:DnaJ-class molecular chaperone